jgi:hypothetical protein
MRSVLALLACLLSLPANAFDGVKLKLPADQLIVTNLHVPLIWATPTYDTLGFFSPAQPTRITIPSGLPAGSKVQIVISGVFYSSPVGMRELVVHKNGTWFEGDPVCNTMAINTTTTDLNCVSSPLDVVAGDYFEMLPRQESGGSLAVRMSTGTWFSLYVLP